MRAVINNIIDYMEIFFFKFKYYIIAFSLGCLAVIVSLLFGRKSKEKEDAKVIKDIVMKDKKEILEVALEESEKIVEEKNTNIIILEDKIKENKEQILKNTQEIEGIEDVRSIQDRFKKSGF